MQGNSQSDSHLVVTVQNATHGTVDGAQDTLDDLGSQAYDHLGIMMNTSWEHVANVQDATQSTVDGAQDTVDDLGSQVDDHLGTMMNTSWEHVANVQDATQSIVDGAQDTVDDLGSMMDTSANTSAEEHIDGSVDTVDDLGSELHAEVQAVVSTFTVLHIEYSALVADPDAEAAFTSAVQSEYVTAADVSPDQVEVTLRQGSGCVTVTVTIRAAATQQAEVLATAISSDVTMLRVSIGQRLSEIEDVATIATGSLEVSPPTVDVAVSQVQVVWSTFTVSNIEYSALIADADAEAAFTSAVQDEYVTAAGVSRDQVDVTLSQDSGCVGVTAIIRAAATQQVGALATAISSSDMTTLTIRQRLEDITEVATLATGSLEVSPPKQEVVVLEEDDHAEDEVMTDGASQVQAVRSTFTVSNIEYSALIADLDAEAAFTSAVQDEYVTAASVSRDQVDVTLSQGSGCVGVTATIRAAATQQVGVLATAISSSDMTTLTIGQRLEDIKEVATLATGSLEVSPPKQEVVVLEALGTREPPVGSGPDKCNDASVSATDAAGNGCTWYSDNAEHCGSDDDSDFTSSAMCCPCGGGAHAEFALWKADVRCQPNDGQFETDLGSQDSAADCRAACVERFGLGCNYFIFGKGSKSSNCWHESDRACNSGEFQADEYDVYKRDGAGAGLPSLPFVIVVEKKEKQVWGAKWETVAFDGIEGLHITEMHSDGLMYEWNQEASPGMKVREGDVVIKVERAGDVAVTCAPCMTKMMHEQEAGTLSLTILHDAETYPPINVRVRKPRDEPIGMEWLMMSPEGDKSGLRITRIESGGVFDRYLQEHLDVVGQKVVLVNDTVIKVSRLDPGERSSSDDPEEMEGMLKRVGELEIVVERSAPRPFNCIHGVNNLPTEWDSKKRDYCERTTAAPTPAATAAPTPAPAPPGEEEFVNVPGYNCSAGLLNWERGWSLDKKDFCCEEQEWRTGQTARKEWCCKDRRIGCEDHGGRQFQNGTVEVVLTGIDYSSFCSMYQDAMNLAIERHFGYAEVTTDRIPAVADGSPSTVVGFHIQAECVGACQEGTTPKEGSYGDFTEELRKTLEAQCNDTSDACSRYDWTEWNCPKGKEGDDCPVDKAGNGGSCNVSVSKACCACGGGFWPWGKGQSVVSARMCVGAECSVGGGGEAGGGEVDGGEAGGGDSKKTITWFYWILIVGAPLSVFALALVACGLACRRSREDQEDRKKSDASEKAPLNEDQGVGTQQARPPPHQGVGTQQTLSQAQTEASEEVVEYTVEGQQVPAPEILQIMQTGQPPQAAPPQVSLRADREVTMTVALPSQAGGATPQQEPLPPITLQPHQQLHMFVMQPTTGEAAAAQLPAGEAAACQLRFSEHTGALEIGSDMVDGGLVMTVDQAKAWCAQNTGCVGFTVDTASRRVFFKSAWSSPKLIPGWVSYRVVTQDQVDAEAFGFEESRFGAEARLDNRLAACERRVDRVEDRVASWQAAQAAPATQPAVVAWQAAETAFVSQGGRPAPWPAEPVVSQVPQPPAPAEPVVSSPPLFAPARALGVEARFSEHFGVLTSGSDLIDGGIVMSIEDAKTWCLANPTCVGFTVDRATGRVYFKSTWAFRERPGWVSYRAEPPEAPQPRVGLRSLSPERADLFVAGSSNVARTVEVDRVVVSSARGRSDPRFSEHFGVLGEGNDLVAGGEIMTLDEAKAACLRLPGCVGFTVNKATGRVFFKSSWILKVSAEWMSYRAELPKDKECASPLTLMDRWLVPGGSTIQAEDGAARAIRLQPTSAPQAQQTQMRQWLGAGAPSLRAEEFLRPGVGNVS